MRQRSTPKVPSTAPSGSSSDSSTGPCSMWSSRYAAACSSCRRAAVAWSRSTPFAASASGRPTPSRSVSRRSASWSVIEPAAADEPNSERPNRAPSSSAQLTSRTVTAGAPSSAIRRNTSAPATTLRQPSSQPPFGTESIWPPIRTARSERPRKVAPVVAGFVALALERKAVEQLCQPGTSRVPRVGPGNALGAVLVARQSLQLAQLRDDARGVESHVRKRIAARIGSPTCPVA